MVLPNTSLKNLEVKHFVYVPTSNCVIVTTKDRERNRIKLYLVLTGENRAYQRNGINQTWDELDSFDSGRIEKLVCEAFSDKRIPRYRTATLN